jgi:hypothetical protein
VAVVHALVLVLTLLALLCLPAFLAMILCADEILTGLSWRIAGWREAREQRRTIRRLDRAVGAVALPADVDLPEDAPGNRPPIEQIAADLRRLGEQRLGVATRSLVWHTAVTRAYDDQLRLASRCLGVGQHLDSLDGVDLEIERVRVEGELAAAGLVLPSAAPERRREQR